MLANLRADFFVSLGRLGEVVVGKIGDDLRMDYTAQGQTVALAARMEQFAAPGEVYISEHTAKLVSGFFKLHTQMLSLFTEVCHQDLEGIVAKRADGVYDVAALPAWLKIKNPEYSQARDRQELFAHAARDLPRNRALAIIPPAR
jgi:Adenylate and Guanylate cyclase catalytic domain